MPPDQYRKAVSDGYDCESQYCSVIGKAAHIDNLPLALAPFNPGQISNCTSAVWRALVQFDLGLWRLAYMGGQEINYPNPLTDNLDSHA